MLSLTTHALLVVVRPWLQARKSLLCVLQHWHKRKLWAKFFRSGDCTKLELDLSCIWAHPVRASQVSIVSYSEFPYTIYSSWLGRQKTVDQNGPIISLFQAWGATKWGPCHLLKSYNGTIYLKLVDTAIPVKWVQTNMFCTGSLSQKIRLNCWVHSVEGSQIPHFLFLYGFNYRGNF
jgi:hypothetical protein